MTTEDPQTALDDIAGLAERFAVAQAARDAAMAELAAGIVAADRAGIPRVQIVKASRLARRTVYKILPRR